jgi:hypothetical protein
MNFDFPIRQGIENDLPPGVESLKSQKTIAAAYHCVIADRLGLHGNVLKNRGQNCVSLTRHFHPDSDKLTLSKDKQLRGATGSEVTLFLLHIDSLANWRVIERRNHIIDPYPGPRGGSVGIDKLDQGATGGRKSQ